ncbi:MAG: alpha/beta hydrolase [Archangium sp.]|nr:alpha/beta hydrolase [Archangium sp.]
MKTTVFKSEQAKVVLTQWFDRFRAKLEVPTESRVVQTRFGATHVLVGGPENGAPLVLLHGAMASSAHALVELAPLLRAFRVYAVDVVGQSVKSADARPSVSNDEYGRWLAEVMDGLSLPRAQVVAVSWGGFVAIRLAALAPRRITRLVLLVPAGLVSGSAWAGFLKMGLPMALYLMAPSEARLQKFVKHLLTTTNDDWAPYLGDAFRSFNMNMTVPMLAKPEELKGFTAPTLVLAADNDVSFPGQKVLDRAVELFPSLAGTELIKGSLHCPPTTDEFRAWLGGRITSFMQG